MNSRYQILHNGYRYVIQDLPTELYHVGFVFGVPWTCRHIAKANMFRWQWTAKRAVKALEHYDREQARKAEVENSNFKPI